MSFANVLPSAPELYPMAEISQINAEDFRLKKISDLLKELTEEAEHYRQVAKKYKRSTLPCAHLGGWPWVAFCWAILRSPGNGIDRVRHCCKPRACWRCYGLRAGLCWLCCHKQTARTESDQTREDLYTGPC